MFEARVTSLIDTKPDFNEYFSGFKSIGHNDWFTLFLFYGVMKYDQQPHSSRCLLINAVVYGLSSQLT